MNLNQNFKINLMKIEQLGSGAVYCQVFDSIFPQVIPMGRINWKANVWNEFVANFKILQQGFDKIGIEKEIPVNKLIKAKLMDNLEFSQWLKSYYDQNCDLLKIYDPVERRGNCEVDLSFADKGAKGNTHRVT
jgi:RP/EB family microtubule-associated protein